MTPRPDAYLLTIRPSVPAVTVEAEIERITEGETATFTLTRYGDTTGALQVSSLVRQSYARSEVVASTLAAGARQVALTVQTTSDEDARPDGVVRVELRAASTYRPVEHVGADGIDHRRASVAVVNDDLPKVSIAADAVTVTEGTAATFTLARSEEWGAGGSLRLAPRAAGRGPSLSVSTTWGEAASGVEQLWSQGAGSAGLAGNGVAAPAGRLAAELGYGMETAGGEGLVTPYAGVTLAAGAAPAYRLGGRLSLGPSFSLELEAARRASAAAAPEHGLKLNASRRWYPPVGPTTLQSLSWPGRQVYAGARGCRHCLPVHGARVPRTAVNCGREGTRTPGRRGGEPIPSSPLWDAREATRGVRRVAR